MGKLPMPAPTHLPTSLGEGTAVDVISSTLSWLEQREKRLEAEARLDNEVKVQKMRTVAYGKELKANLKALKIKCKANERYLKAQVEDRNQSRQDIAAVTIEQIKVAHQILGLLENKDHSEMPSEKREELVSALVLVIREASKVMEGYPSGPLATLG